MKVLLLSKYPRKGASSRLRSLQYLPALAAAGVEVRVQSLFDEQYLSDLYRQGRRPGLRTLLLYLQRLCCLPTAFAYDLVWIEKELFPYCPALFERLLSRLGVRYVVDYDDAIFHNYDLAGNHLLRRLLGRKIDAVMAHAGCVIAGNQYLAERARQAGAARVEIIPTVVDHCRYHGSDRYHGIDKEGERQPVIGWIGSPSTQKYLLAIREPLHTACEQMNARLLLVGATPEVADQLPGIAVDTVAWSEDTEAACIARMDVGIMPLVDGPWEKGKCGYKLIQYMASGVPVVASAVGVNVEIVSSCDCGRLANTAEEWTAALLELLAGPGLRHRLGRAGRNIVASRYSLAAQAPVLAGILKSTAG